MSDKPAQGGDDDAAEASTPRRDMIVLGAQVAVGVGIVAGGAAKGGIVGGGTV